MRRTLLIVLVAVLSACSSKKDKVIDPPAELTDFPATLRVQRTWDAGLGGKGEELRLGIGVSIEDGRVFGASHDGDVAAFALDSGRMLWRTRTKAPLAGGTGAGHGLVVVGTSEGAVIALDATNGAQRWQVKVSGEVLAAPAVAAQAVLVRTVDGRLRGLALDTGKELWMYEQNVPRLSLRGTAVPVISGNAVICGFDNGKVVALNIPDGSLLWETTVAPSRGRTELERLVDIDSAVKVYGNYVYAVGFQGRVAMLALDSGQIWWAQDASSYRGLVVDDDNVYVSTSDGEVVALKRSNGTEVWRQKALAHRGLSAPVLTDDAVAVADFKGYVHWLDKATGALAARAQAGGNRVSNPPMADGNRVVVINDDARITEFRTSPLQLAATPKQPAKAEEPAPAEPAAPAPPPELPTTELPTTEPGAPPAAPAAPPSEPAAPPSERTTPPPASETPANPPEPEPAPRGR